MKRCILGIFLIAIGIPVLAVSLHPHCFFVAADSGRHSFGSM
jgi:hypothetical protein